MEKLNLSTLGKLFSNEDKARELMENLRWKDGVICPHCEGEKNYKITPKEGSKTRQGVWKCAACKKQFTVTTGTIFHGSHIPISKWLMAVHLICSSKKGISALQLQRNLGLGSYRTAFFMAHRVRYAMSQEPLLTKLRNTVEIDETYVGGISRNMHPTERKRRITGGGSNDMAPVVTLVERGGRVKTHHMEHITGKNLKKAIRDCVAPVASIRTDEYPAYKGLIHSFADHQAVNHSKKEYVRGLAHVNTAESVHALLKRGVMGTYHHWSKKHLHRYLAEFDFRWNFRKVSDGERTAEAIALVGGKRLKYSDPVKKS